MRRMGLGEIDTEPDHLFLFFCTDLVAETFLPLFEFGCEIGAEVFGFEDGADFEFCTGVATLLLRDLRFAHISHKAWV